MSSEHIEPPTPASLDMSQIQNDYDLAGAPLYFPLDDSVPQIRLVKVIFLQPDELGDSTITCSMITTSIESVEDQYLALSYAWGNSDDRRPLVINNHQHSVTANLEDFLRVWRRKAVQEREEPLDNFYLWIDAICINQDDLLERKSQVMLMSKIYSKAKRTLAWLGQGCSSCEYGVESMGVLGAHFKNYLHDDNKTNYLKQEAWPSRSCAYEEGIDSDIKNRAWRGIRDLYSVEYWRRAWVQQEYVLAKVVSIWYGEMEARSVELQAVYEWLKRIFGQDRPEFFSSELWYQLAGTNNHQFFHQNDPQTRLDFLSMAKDPELLKYPRTVFILLFTLSLGLRASDPRDLLYSLLGILDLEIAADYQDPVEKVYYRFARRWITRPGGLIFLLGARGPSSASSHPENKEDNSYPTWIPWWNSQKTNFLIFKRSSQADINGRGDLEEKNSRRVSGRRLIVQGRIISRVKTEMTTPQSLIERYLDGLISADPSTAYFRFQSLVLLFCEKHGATRDSKDLTWTQTLHLVRTVAYNMHIHLSTSISEVLRWMGMLNIGDVASILNDGRIPPGIDPLEPTINGEPSHGLLKHNRELQILLKDSTIFATTNDCLAWSLREVEVDDIVCVLSGLRTPVILRGSKSSYQFISPCSIVGMQCEDIPDANSEPNKLETFNIY